MAIKYNVSVLVDATKQSIQKKVDGLLEQWCCCVLK